MSYHASGTDVMHSESTNQNERQLVKGINSFLGYFLSILNRLKVQGFKLYNQMIYYELRFNSRSPCQNFTHLCIYFYRCFFLYCGL